MFLFILSSIKKASLNPVVIPLFIFTSHLPNGVPIFSIVSLINISFLEPINHSLFYKWDKITLLLSTYSCSVFCISFIFAPLVLFLLIFF